MKRLVVCIIIFLISFNLIGQEKDAPIETKSEVGLVVSDLINGAFQFKYERLVGKQLSVGLGIGYKGDKGIIKLSGLDTDHVKTGDLTYSGLKIIPEVRYYFKKTMLSTMDGFYIGGYGKHSSFKSDLDGTYINDLSENYDIEFDAKIRVTSIGFTAGYKYRISDRFVIDFLIAGPGVGFHSYELTQKKDLPDDFFDDLNEALQNYSIFDLIDGKFEFNENNAKTNFSALSFRYGITIGYSF